MQNDSPSISICSSRSRNRRVVLVMVPRSLYIQRSGSEDPPLSFSQQQQRRRRSPSIVPRCPRDRHVISRSTPVRVFRAKMLRTDRRRIIRLAGGMSRGGFCQLTDDEWRQRGEMEIVREKEGSCAGEVSPSTGALPRFRPL